MSRLATTRLSSKGQVVIPEEIRRALDLEPGDRFLVLCDGDVVLLKRIEAPRRGEVRALAKRVREQSKKAGIRPGDVAKAVQDVRRRPRRSGRR